MRFVHKLRTNPAATRGMAAVVAFLVLWEMAGQVRLINPNFTSYPSRIARLAWDLSYSGKIYPHLAISLQELFLGFVAAAAVGVMMGLATGRVRRLDYVTSPFVNTLYSTPRMVFLPLFIIWLGIGLWSKVLLIFLGALFPILINTYHGVKGTDPSLVEAARSYGARERDVFFKVVLWAAMPFVVAGLRMGMGRALISVAIAELYAASAGMGFLVVTGGASMNADLVFAAGSFFVIAGLLFNYGLRYGEKRIAPWLYERQAE
ncbi:MAG: ABC transporter permease [Dehalococcoidia bacterium]|nr:ABC transporter permease [Dehalococcoidia bacterium]